MVKFVAIYAPFAFTGTNQTKNFSKFPRLTEFPLWLPLEEDKITFSNPAQSSKTKSS